jgi:valyl-tRNA synthetase
VDPLDLIAHHGADALRFALASQAAQGRDVRVSEQRVEGYRHFCNKVWNAHRFVVGQLGPEALPVGPWDGLPLDAMDRWVLARLDAAIRDVTEALEAYRFDEAARLVYDFIWHEYCDWYLETAKVRLQDDAGPAGRAAVRRVLVVVLETALRLLHPMMPFLTEEVWQRLPHEGSSIMLAAWPKPLGVVPPHASDLKVAEALMAITRAVRTIRAEMNIPPSEVLPQIVVRSGDAVHLEAAASLGHYLRRLARVSHVVAGPEVEAPSPTGTQAVGSAMVYVPLTRDHLEKERDRLGKEIVRAEEELAKLEKKLATPGFVAKAPPEVVLAARAQRDERAAGLAALREHLAHIQAALAGS